MRRFSAALVTIAACVVVSFAATPDGSGRADDPRLGLHATETPKPPSTSTPRGNDSCQHANDNECDEPTIGTGLCRTGTDNSDCRRLRAGIEDDSCQYANDGECDEPRIGTDSCVQATDATDCAAIIWMRNLNDSCDTSYNGVCEEPGVGNGACAARTDRSDCHGRERPATIDDHFYGRDDRVRIDPQQAPWRFMGSFTNGIGERCTATLISRDVIMTAAHCVSSEDGIHPDGTFAPAAGGPTARSIAYLISTTFDYQRFIETNEVDAHDWALVRLNRPLGEELGYASVRRFTRRELAAPQDVNLQQAGYSWDTGDLLSANIDCHPIQFYDDGAFAHACDTTQGDSGSGFLIRSGRRYHLVGVDSKFRSNPGGPAKSIAVGSGAFFDHVADFVAGRTGRPANSSPR